MSAAVNAPREHESKDCWCGHIAHKPDPARDYRELICVVCTLEARA